MNAVRLPDNPIITPASSPTIGGNINGPSLIRVPDWVERPLGRYYLYFAHHKGQFIRMAYADELTGPWTVYEPDVLHRADTPYRDHIASPDVHVDHERKRLVMFYHGAVHGFDVTPPPGAAGVLGRGTTQLTSFALSADGLRFHSRQVWLAGPYLRVWWWGGTAYGISWGGRLWRSEDGRTRFEERERWLGHDLCSPRSLELDPEAPGGRFAPRHVAVRRVDDRLEVYFSRIGDTPERILRSDVALTADWDQWRASEPVDVIAPRHAWEGAALPMQRSGPGKADQPVHALRDPAIFEEAGRTYLLYSIAGERGLAIAELRP